MSAAFGRDPIMDDTEIHRSPAAVRDIVADTERAPKVPALIHEIERRGEFATVKLAWASGLMIVVRRGARIPSDLLQ